MHQQYKDIAFQQTTLALIDTMNEIVEGYTEQGFRLTVRQLYYQLVARAIIENTERSYKRVTSIVNDARLAGLMDWDAIEDRTRAFIRNNVWNSPREILDACASQYKEDMWFMQDVRVFCVVEKEALAGVLEKVCRKWDVPLLAARGYPSGTVLREFAINDILQSTAQDIVILHFGDHDPSGIDMTRDLTERLSLFSDQHIDLRRIALTMDQIDEQNPPPNPAKVTDSRFSEYQKRFGSKSWELDALSPTYLAGLVDQHVSRLVDKTAWRVQQDRVAEIRQRIRATAVAFGE